MNNWEHYIEKVTQGSINRHIVVGFNSFLKMDRKKIEKFFDVLVQENGRRRLVKKEVVQERGDRPKRLKKSKVPVKEFVEALSFNNFIIYLLYSPNK